MRLYIVGLVLLVSGCELIKPKVVTVQVPVATPCLSSRPTQPKLKFDLLPQASTEAESAEHVRMLWLDRQNLIAHSLDWDVAASGCEIIINKVK
jgi:hypothetical protein